jgi:hypothetical protein
MRKLNVKKALLALALFVGTVPMLAGCNMEKDNSAGGIGKKIDSTLDPRGPAQKVGDKVDNALGK